MNILSWNVNGAQSCLQDGELDWIDTQNCEIVCLQEIKRRKPLDFLPDYYGYYNYGNNPGYSGVAVLCREKAKDRKDLYSWDEEGRIIILEFEELFLINIYAPNPMNDSLRRKDRNTFDVNLMESINKIKLNKPLIICGDFNAVDGKKDISEGSWNSEKDPAKFNERTLFMDLKNLGLIDPYRYFYPDEVTYSQYSNRHNNRLKLRGVRIDYFFISRELTDMIKSIAYLQSIPGSDHCPCILTLSDVSKALNEIKLKYSWNSFDFKKIKKEIERKQELIGEALLNRDFDLVLKLQDSLAHNIKYRALAIKISSERKYAAHVKDINLAFDHQKMEQAYKCWIDSFRSDPIHDYIVHDYDKDRTIGKLTRRNWAIHQLVSWGIKPIVETLGDKNSFSARNGKDTRRALLRIFTILDSHPDLKYICYSDIKSFYETIDHQWVYDNILYNPEYMRRVLTADRLFHKERKPCNGKGVSLGSPISCFLANMVLDGLEEESERELRKIPEFRHAKVRYVRYADDVILLTDSKPAAEKLMEIVENFLRKRRLNLNYEKSFIREIDDSFSFLGYNFTRLDGVTYTRIAEKSMTVRYRMLADIFNNKHATLKSLIDTLNSKITGISNYYKYTSSPEDFMNLQEFIDEHMFTFLKNRNKNVDNEELIKTNSVLFDGVRYWCLPEDKSYILKRLDQMPQANFRCYLTPGGPDDPGEKNARINDLKPNYVGILKRQSDRCFHCGERILPSDQKALIEEDGQKYYVHKSCENLKVVKTLSAQDATLPERVITEVRSVDPYLTDSYRYPGMSKKGEMIRRQLNTLETDEYEFTETTRAVVLRYFRAAEVEGFSYFSHKNHVHLERQQTAENRLTIPEWFKKMKLTESEAKKVVDLLNSLYKAYGF